LPVIDISDVAVLFTKQSTQELFTPQLRKITNTITDIAGKVDIIRQGGDIKKKNPWIQHVQDYSKENGIVYFKALSDPKCKAQHRMRLWLLTIMDYRLLWTIY
jgi:hypothetical protein